MSTIGTVHLVVVIVCILYVEVSLAGENDQRPYDPFADDDDDVTVTSSVPTVPVTRTPSTTTATPATVSTVFQASTFYCYISVVQAY